MESEELSAEEGLPLMLFRGRRSGRGCLRISEVRRAAMANHRVGIINAKRAAAGEPPEYKNYRESG
jgi:hypothetical protein